MLQISQLMLPVDHSDEDLRREILRLLRIRDGDLKSVDIRQRAIDARRRVGGGRARSEGLEKGREGDSNHAGP